MIVDQSGLFENQDQWHKATVLRYLDAARDRLAQPAPDYPAMISELRMAIEFTQLLVVACPAPRGRRNRGKP